MGNTCGCPYYKIDAPRLVSVVQNAIKGSELAVMNQKLAGFLLGEPLFSPENFSEIITCNDKMLSIFKVVEAQACSLQPVLVTCEITRPTLRKKLSQYAPAYLDDEQGGKKLSTRIKLSYYGLLQQI